MLETGSSDNAGKYAVVKISAFSEGEHTVITQTS